MLYNQTPQEKAVIAKVAGALKEFRLTSKQSRPKSSLNHEFDYNLLSRPDKESNLMPASYKIPANKYDAMFAMIMEATFVKGISFTFSEQLDNNHGALVFDLDLHVDPSKLDIKRKGEIETEVRESMADDSEQNIQKEIKSQLHQRSIKGRVLKKDVLVSFVKAVGHVITLFINPAKLNDQYPTVMDYIVRQRTEPKFTDFDKGKSYYDDGAHIQINLDCTVEERIMIRHRMLETEYMQEWYGIHISEYLYEPAYSLSSTRSSLPIFSDEYAITSIVDFAVSRGSSAFSVIGTHKKGYKPYVLSIFGSLAFRKKERDEQDEDYDEDEEPKVLYKVDCHYSFESEDAVFDNWHLESRRKLPKAIKGYTCIRDLVMNNTITFSARSTDRRAYVSDILGSRLYHECMFGTFPKNYRKHNAFYDPINELNQVAYLSNSNRQENRFGGGGDDEDDEDKVEGDEETRINAYDDDNDSSTDSEDETAMSRKRKRSMTSSSSAGASKRKKVPSSSYASSSSRKAHKRGREEEESARQSSSAETKKRNKAQKVTDDLAEAATAANNGTAYHGSFDFRKFQDSNRGNVVLITELDLMQCTTMDELERLYTKFIASLDNESASTSAGSNDDLRQAYMCTMALPEKYYCIGSREERIRVCWALRNISDYLLVVWVRFMFQRPDQDFSRMSEWIDNWNSSRRDNENGRVNGYQLGSLKHWVMEHDPKKLVEINNSIFSTKVEKMIDDITINVMVASTVFNNQSRMKSICIGDFQMAQLAEFLVSDRIVLCSFPYASNVVWMKYNEKTGLWKRHATGLSCELSVTLSQYFRNHFNALGAKVATLPQSGKPAAEIKKETEMIMRKMQEILNVQTRLNNHTGKCMIINEAKNLLYRENFLSQLDSNPYLFAFTNGVLDFSVKPPIFRKAEPSDYISVSCGNPYLEIYDGTPNTFTSEERTETYARLDELMYEYGREYYEQFPDKYSHFQNEEDAISEAGQDAIRADPSLLFEALPERFQQIAKEIKEYMRQMFQDPITRSYAYKLASLPMVGFTQKNQFAHLFTGKGKNGKSVFSVDLFKIMYGEYYYAMDIKYWIQASGKAGGAQPELVQARTARWMPSFEPPKGSTLNENTLKLFVGGTDPVNCRTLFEPPIQYVPQYTCSIVSNHNLGLESYDQGGTRRIRSLHFGTYFYDEESGPLQTNSGKPIYQFKKDPTLTTRMKRWGTVFVWVLSKLNTVIDGTLPPLNEVPEVKFHTDNFFNDFDIEGAFIRAYVRYDKDSQVLKCDLNRKYKEWYMNQYAKEPNNIKGLHHRLNEFIDSKQDQMFDDGWYGLKLL